MDEKLIETIENKIAECMNFRAGISFGEHLAGINRSAREIAALLDEERGEIDEAGIDLVNENRYLVDRVDGMQKYITEKPAPETITIAEAVKRLVEWAHKLCYVTVIDTERKCYTWGINDCSVPAENIPNWIMAIYNGGYKPAAYREGLEDLFATILGGDE